MRQAVLNLEESKIREVANAGMGRADVLPFWFGESDEVTPEAIRAAGIASLQAGETFYSHNLGLPALRDAVAAYTSALHGGVAIDRIAITSGGVNALIVAMQALIDAGDEVVAVTPVWPNLTAQPRILGARLRCVALRPDADGAWRLDLPVLLAAITPRTRLMIINSPHNPSGALLSRDDLDQLAALIRGRDIHVISDEVYEHLVFDGAEHLSSARYPGLAERAFIVSSFGKTYHVTGWKVGTVAAPAALSAEFRKVHQFNVFTVNTPMQAGLAQYMQDPAPYMELSAFYQAKRDLFLGGLQGSRLKLLPTAGTYFLCADISSVSDLNEAEFCQWLVREIGVAAIPLSAFYGDGFDQHVVRFCFAKKDETLIEAAARLRQL